MWLGFRASLGRSLSHLVLSTNRIFISCKPMLDADRGRSSEGYPASALSRSSVPSGACLRNSRAPLTAAIV